MQLAQILEESETLLRCSHVRLLIACAVHRRIGMGERALHSDEFQCDELQSQRFRNREGHKALQK